ncbi:MAG: hypothetical protein ACLSV7_07560 [Oscillospiraceae bacterium]|nr:hypothetical protein [Bacillota bacterium]
MVLEAALGGQAALAEAAALAARVPGMLAVGAAPVAVGSRLSARWGLFGFCQMDP